MSELPTKEKQYEELVNAVSGGELSMVKFLWKLLNRLESTQGIATGKEIQKIQNTVNSFMDNWEKNPPKNGETPTMKELTDLIKPLIPKPLKGDTPTKKELKAIIEKLMPDPEEAPEPIKPTKKELKALIKPLLKPGNPGRMPRHQWSGTMIRFELPNGEWGEYHNLQGSPGEVMPGGFGGPGGGLETILGEGFKREGVQSIYFGDNLTITRTGNGVRIDAEAGGVPGTGLDFETPTGTVDDSNVTFTVTETPLYLVINGAQYFEGVHYSLSTLTITLNDPIGTGGFIRSAFGTGITVETPTGTIDDSNVTFTVLNEPKYIVINGAQYFDGAGYSYSGGTITLDNPIGTGGFIRSVY